MGSQYLRWELPWGKKKLASISPFQDYPIIQRNFIWAAVASSKLTPHPPPLLQEKKSFENFQIFSKVKTEKVRSKGQNPSKMSKILITQSIFLTSNFHSLIFFCVFGGYVFGLGQCNASCFGICSVVVQCLSLQAFSGHALSRVCSFLPLPLLLLFLCLFLPLSLFPLLPPPLYFSSCIPQLKLCMYVCGDFYLTHSSALLSTHFSF